MLRNWYKRESEIASKGLNIVIIDIRVHLSDASQVLKVVWLIADFHHKTLLVFLVSLHDGLGTTTALVKSGSIHAVCTEVSKIASDLLRNDS